MLSKLYIVIMFGSFSLLANAIQPNRPLHAPLSLLQTTKIDPAAKPYDWHKLKHYSYQNYRQFRGPNRQFYRGNRSIYRNDLRIYNGGQRLNNIGTRFRGNIYINPRGIYRNNYRFNNFPNGQYDGQIITNRPNRFQHFNDDNDLY